MCGVSSRSRRKRKVETYLIQNMRDPILQDQVRSQDLRIVDKDVVAPNRHRDSGTSLRYKLGAICKCGHVADEIGYHVAIHERGGCGIGPGDISAGEGGIGGDESGDTGSGVELGGQV